MKKNINKNERVQPYRDDMPDIPPGFIDWSEGRTEGYSWGTPVIYYKRKNKTTAECFCTTCGEYYQIKTRRGDSYEAQFETVYETPVKDAPCRCVKCNTQSIYKQSGRCKQVNKGEDVYVIQKFKSIEGIVLRWFNIRITYGPTVKRDFIQIECGREYFPAGKYTVLRDYNLYDYYAETKYWDAYNLGGYANIVFPYAEIYPESYKELNGTEFEYCCIREYGQGIYTKIKVNEYLEKYREFPIIEFFIKNGMAMDIWHLDKDNAVRHERDLLKALKLDKRTFNRWMKWEKNKRLSYLQWHQYECSNRIELTDEQLDFVRNFSVDELKEMLQYMTLQKAMNYIRKESGRTGRAMRTVLTTWKDYMAMAKKLGMNLDDEIVYRSKNLIERHDALVAEINKRNAEQEADEYRSRFPEIEKNLRKAKEKYAYEDDTYLIRTPESVGEIIQESRSLRHCVATSDRYFDRMNRNETIILFVRKKTAPDVPYYTLEVEPNGNIRQKRTEYNRQTGLEDIIPTLKAFQMAIRSKMTQKDREQQKYSDKCREKDMADLLKKSPEFAQTLDDDYMAADDAEELTIPQELLDMLQDAG